ncbi:hypothetical protein OS493_039724, partial [Desmophyllum pertusum]
LPGKPLITNLDKNVPVDTEFTITWLAPKYDGGDSAITYKLELRMTPITKDTEVRIEENITETQFMIKGLENGKTYQVTLVAVNEAGSSEPAVGMLKTKSKTGEPKIRKYQGDPVTRRLTQGNNVTFHCDVESGHPNTSRHLVVMVSPKIDPMEDEIIKNEQEQVDIECVVSGDPTPIVEWFHHGSYYPGQTTLMRGDKKVAKISFTNIHIYNTGDYTCQAKNGAMDSCWAGYCGEGNSKALLSPKIDPMEDEIIKNEQEQVDIECVVSGDPTPIVEWFHHGSYYPGQTTLMRGDKKVAKISFTNIHIYNTGDYTCQAKKWRPWIVLGRLLW